MLDLGSGVFTCFTPGYYTVSFSAYAHVQPIYRWQTMFLYVNGRGVPESRWHFGASEDAVNDNVGSTGCRIVVSNPMEIIV